MNDEAIFSHTKLCFLPHLLLKLLKRVLNREASDTTRGDLHTICTPKKGPFLIQPPPITFITSIPKPFDQATFVIPSISHTPHLKHPFMGSIALEQKLICSPISLLPSEWLSYPYLAPQPKLSPVIMEGTTGSRLRSCPLHAAVRLLIREGAVL